MEDTASIPFTLVLAGFLLGVLLAEATCWLFFLRKARSLQAFASHEAPPMPVDGLRIFALIHTLLLWAAIAVGFFLLW